MHTAKRYILLAAVLMFFGLAGFAQRNDSTSQSSKGSGLYNYTSLTTGHDSSAGWSSEMISAVGYDFSPHFSLEAGTPFWLVTTTQGTLSTGTTTNTTHSNSLGDAFIRLKAQSHSHVLNYATGLTLTAPTGDTSAGVSTGRATFNWNNRLEHEFEHVSPFGEASVGNSLTSDSRHRRDYTTLGAVSEFRGGVTFDLFRRVNLETSAYGDAGYGNQKVYSQNVRKGSSGQGNSKHNRSYETNYLTAGSASLVNDYGFSADLSWNVTPRVETGIGFTHSVHYASDSVSVTLGMRLGHMVPKAERQ